MVTHTDAPKHPRVQTQATDELHTASGFSFSPTFSLCLSLDFKNGMFCVHGARKLAHLKSGTAECQLGGEGDLEVKVKEKGKERKDKLKGNCILALCSWDVESVNS